MAKRTSGEKKAFGEPNAALLLGKRWEDLLDAAASATDEEDSRDLTPVRESEEAATELIFQANVRVAPLNFESIVHHIDSSSHVGAWRLSTVHSL